MQQLAVRHPCTLHAHCSSYISPLEFAMHAHADMVESLLRTGAPVDNKMMVEAACHKLHEVASGINRLTSCCVCFWDWGLGRGNPNAFYDRQTPTSTAPPKLATRLRSSSPALNVGGSRQQYHGSWRLHAPVEFLSRRLRLSGRGIHPARCRHQCQNRARRECLASCVPKMHGRCRAILARERHSC